MITEIYEYQREQYHELGIEIGETVGTSARGNPVVRMKMADAKLKEKLRAGWKTDGPCAIHQPAAMIFQPPNTNSWLVHRSSPGPMTSIMGPRMVDALRKEYEDLVR